MAVVLLGVVGVACKKSAPEGEPAGAAVSAPAAPVAAAAAPGVLGKGVIRGSVHFTGKAPELRAVTTPDPFCSRHPLKDEDVLVDASGGLANVWVHVVKGANGSYPPPAAPAVVDQSACMYRPRVQGIVAGQSLEIRNSDQTLHNVHTYRGASTVFNQAQIPGMAPMSKKVGEAGQVIKFRCDVHNWMTGYVGVSANPFFAVSGADGGFTIDKLPPGSYTLEAWHERLGTRTADVVVAEETPAKATFDFAPP